MRPSELRIIGFAAALASAGGVVLACGEVLGAGDSTDPPARDLDGGTEAAESSDAADVQSDGGGDAGGGDDGGGDASAPTWSCTTTSTSMAYGSLVECQTARNMAACIQDASAAPEGQACSGDSDSVYCPICRKVNLAFVFDTVTCDCQP